jgi:AraC-like DNA-binding protein
MQNKAAGLTVLWAKNQKNVVLKKPFDPEIIKTIAMENRTTFKDLSNALGMSLSTLHRRFKEGEFRLSLKCNQANIEWRKQKG